MNLLLAVVADGRRAVPGRRSRPRIEDQPPVVGAVTPVRRPREPAFSPAIASSRSPIATSTLGAVLHRGRHPAQSRDVARASCATASSSTRSVTPAVRAGQSRFEIGDIGVLPNVHPHVPSVTPGEPARTGRPQGRRRRRSPSTAKPITFSIAAAGGHREASRTADHDVDPARRRAADVSSARRRRRRVSGCSASASPTRRKSIKPGAVEAVAMSVQKNVEYAGLIFQTVWGLITRETSPKQLMGPVAIAQLSGESAQLGWIALFSLMASISLNLGLLNLLPIPVLDGGHIFIMALEGDRAPRLQHAREREDAARGLRRADDADGDGHLQRSDPHQLDRAPDALALAAASVTLSCQVSESARTDDPESSTFEPSDVTALSSPRAQRRWSCRYRRCCARSTETKLRTVTAADRRLAPACRGRTSRSGRCRRSSRTA